MKRWGARPITDITPEEVAAAIRAIVKRGSPYQAHNALGYIRRLFNWAIGTHEFGIRSSPVEQLKPKDLIGKREARERTLSGEELRAVWAAGGEMGYPTARCYSNRSARARGRRHAFFRNRLWQKLWTVLAERMKGGRAHEVPVGPIAYALLESVPKWSGGQYIFTTTQGEKPVNGFSKAKARIDKLSGVSTWVIHDLRRTMRTHLSALPVQDLVRELVIAHAKPGLHKVYDQHAYETEKRLCLELWEARLLAIVEPRSANISELTRARERGVSRQNAEPRD